MLGGRETGERERHPERVATRERGDDTGVTVDDIGRVDSERDFYDRPAGALGSGTHREAADGYIQGLRVLDGTACADDLDVEFAGHAQRLPDRLIGTSRHPLGEHQHPGKFRAAVCVEQPVLVAKLPTPHAIAQCAQPRVELVERDGIFQDRHGGASLRRQEDQSIPFDASAAISTCARARRFSIRARHRAPRQISG